MQPMLVAAASIGRPESHFNTSPHRAAGSAAHPTSHDANPPWLSTPNALPIPLPWAQDRTRVPEGPPLWLDLPELMLAPLSPMRP